MNQVLAHLGLEQYPEKTGTCHTILPNRDSRGRDLNKSEKQYKNMTTKMKRQGSTELPRFAVGALAIAGASAANAATVQITFTGSFISSTGGNQLDTDFGNDSVADLVGQVASYGLFISGSSALVAEVTNNFTSPSPLGEATYVIYTGDGYGYIWNGLVPVKFSDDNIRGGQMTDGWLNISTFRSQTTGEKSLTVNRLIFDHGGAILETRPRADGSIFPTPYFVPAFPEYDASTSGVPEPSSLGLLALGAGGLLARRRRSQAA